MSVTKLVTYSNLRTCRTKSLYVQEKRFWYMTIVTLKKANFFFNLRLAYYSNLLRSEKNHRIVYKHVQHDLYLHYNDFGILEGTNWMVSESQDDTVGFLVTQNLENRRQINQCVTVAGEAGPWMVLSDFGWQLDKTVFVTC